MEQDEELNGNVSNQCGYAGHLDGNMENVQNRCGDARNQRET